VAKFCRYLGSTVHSGKESAENDIETLVREIDEELGVAITPGTAREAKVFEAREDGRADDVTVRPACYTEDYSGALKSNSEIAEFACRAALP
jgi:8-oxo-dGTP pyrophosphatase MutT (NUDIX family)